MVCICIKYVKKIIKKICFFKSIVIRMFYFFKTTMSLPITHIMLYVMHDDVHILC